MKKKPLVIISAIIGLFFTNKPTTSFALPIWWDNPDFQTSGSGEFTRPNATDPAGGSLEVHLDNVEILSNQKRLYFVLDWETTNPTNAIIATPVWFSWDSSTEHFYPGWTGGTLEVNQVIGNTHHLEYSYLIDPQPDDDWAKIDWVITTTGETISYSYDFRSSCVPEPNTILLLGTGLALFAGARRKIIA